MLETNNSEKTRSQKLSAFLRKIVRIYFADFQMLFEGDGPKIH